MRKFVLSPFLMMAVVINLLLPIPWMQAEEPQSEPNLPHPDDTAGFIHLTPDPIPTLCESTFHIAIIATLTNARVFDLTFLFPHSFFQLQSVTPGSAPGLHLLPAAVSGDTLWMDGFFHPNFTGTTTLAVLTVYSLGLAGDDTSLIGFLQGQGYSGSSEGPEGILLSGDSTTVYVDCTPPENPWQMIITPVHADSVLLQWHPIFFDVNGDTVIHPLYVIYRTDQLLLPPTPDSAGATFDTFFCDDYVQISHPMPPDTQGNVSYMNVSTYEVRARKTQP